ncbi:MAG: glutamate racemase [Maricaulaceae bacterium]
MKQALVFDSGVGGLSVCDAIAQAKLTVRLDYLADTAWLPYGDKPDAALQARVPALIAQAVGRLAPDAVVLACNTASTLALDRVRAAVSVPVVGVVPPIKPAAAASRSGVIAVLATPATVRRAYIDDLIDRFAAGTHVRRVGSTALVTAAEATLAGRAPEASDIAPALEAVFSGEAGARVDAVALGCTHFPLVLEALRARAPRPVAWFDPGPAVARRLSDVLALDAHGAPQFGTAFFTAPEAGEPRTAFTRRGFALQIWNAPAASA